MFACHFPNNNIHDACIIYMGWWPGVKIWKIMRNNLSPNWYLFPTLLCKCILFRSMQLFHTGKSRLLLAKQQIASKFMEYLDYMHENYNRRRTKAKIQKKKKKKITIGETHTYTAIDRERARKRMPTFLRYIPLPPQIMKFKCCYHM